MPRVTGDAAGGPLALDHQHVVGVEPAQLERRGESGGTAAEDHDRHDASSPSTSAASSAPQKKPWHLPM